MWPGQQPESSRDPRQQQVEPNPYHQPGYQQHNPYVAPKPEGGRRTRTIAISVAAVVVVASAVTGTALLGGGDDDGAEPVPTSPGTASASPTATSESRDGEDLKPTVAGWKVVVNPDIGVAFDVPADWARQSKDWVSYVAEDDDPEETPLVAMKAPAVLKEQWCTSDDDKDGSAEHTDLASAGTRGNKRGKSTEDIARTDSANWVYGAYTQPDRTKVTTGSVEAFTTASGLVGSVATSESSGVTKQDKCDSDGKATTFAFENSEGDFASWSFVGVKGARDEVPDATIRQIMDTVRLYPQPTDH
ncbi:hypothetical protein AB0I00_22055 [Streptomyces sp. NPDC050803]|uniref:hypothetical protein n=1 Tax=unclassified Streptomyces TaxID=2593676 RepID=UPI00343165CF